MRLTDLTLCQTTNSTCKDHSKDKYFCSTLLWLKELNRMPHWLIRNLPDTPMAAIFGSVHFQISVCISVHQPLYIMVVC
jgi:hypothetical protein